MAASHILIMNSITRNDFDKKQRSETIFLSIKLHMRLTYARRHFETGFFIDKKCVFDLCFLSKLQLCSSINYMPEIIFSNKRSSHPEVLLSKATLLKPHFSMVVLL